MAITARGPLGTVSIVRWIARIWSVATILLVLGFIVGEGVPPRSRLDQWLGFLFFPFGICAGMVVAWRREALGGAITVASLGVFYLVVVATVGVFPAGWAWLVFAAPGFLFLLASFLSTRISIAAQ